MSADRRAELSEWQVLTLTLWGEARSEPIEGIVAVGLVIQHRVVASGGTYRSVCLAPAQFSCWSPVGGAANAAAVAALAAHLLDDHGETRAGSAGDTAAFLECGWVASGLLEHRLRDSVAGATHYLTRALWETAPPAWSRGLVPVARVGRHVFFKLAFR